MALAVLATYSDYLCTKQGLPLQPGAAAFFGDLASWSNWGSVNGIPYKYSINPADIVLSGGAAIYDFKVPYNLPIIDDPNTEYDMASSWQYETRKVWNPYFINIENDRNRSWVLSIRCVFNASTGYSQYIASLEVYTQTPFGQPKSDRTSWSYSDYCTIGGMQEYNPDYSQIKVYRGTIEEIECYFFVLNVKANGETSAALTRIMAIPISYFGGRIPEPYVGPVSEESVAASFVPVTERHDEITSRTNYDVNPYGVNTGSGIKVIFPNVLQNHSVYNGNMQQIINGIYRGSATGLINMATQYIAEMTGGNSARPQDEIQVILNGIFSAHSIPIIFPPGSAGYETNATQFKSICGYDILLNQIDVTSPGQKTIFEYTYTTDTIEQRLNCFLDFEPYTDITMKLPFFPAMSLQPSMLYGNRLKITYKIDVLTGVLSADVAIIYFGKEVIISTIQQNVKTSIPIMGAGATDGALNKIATSAISLISSFGSVTHGSGEDATTGLTFNAGAAAGAILTGADAISRAGTAVPIGKKSVDGLGVYLSPRTAYLIITHPEAAIPASNEDGRIIGSFLDTFGMAASLGGKVGDFAGGYASFSSVDLSGFEATEAEKDAIRSALFEGVMV